MKYSMTLAPFRKIEPIGQTLSKLSVQGYDAVEMYGEPEIDLKKLEDTLSVGGLPVCGITGMWGRASDQGWKRKLLSADRGMVAAAQKYVSDCIQMCSRLGGKETNICLFSDDNGFDANHDEFSHQEKKRLLNRTIPILNKLCKEAADSGVRLVLEPLNRYSTPYCANAADAVYVARQVGNMGLLLDTFHMNIEEDSIDRSILSSGDLLWHTHFADNNRKMPGFGHIDFSPIVKSLIDIGYQGYLSFEPNIANDKYDPSTKAGLEYLKGIEYLHCASASTA